MKTAWMLVVLGLLLLVVESAEACNRCGHHGTACYFHKPVAQAVAPVVNHHKDVVVVNTLIGVPVPTYYGGIAPQGNTLFGYGQQQGYLGLQPPKPIDYASIIRGNSKLADGMLAVVREANASNNAIGQQQLQLTANLAAIEAAGNANAKLVQSSIETQASSNFSTSNGQQVERPLQGGVAALVFSNCVTCHKAQGVKLDLTQIYSFTTEEIDHVIDRLISTDPELRMPPPPSKSLSAAQLGLFYEARSRSTAGE